VIDRDLGHPAAAFLIGNVARQPIGIGFLNEKAL
jgi:hypothetical protein